MSDTPRTDKASLLPESYNDLLRVSRELERELNALRQSLIDAETAGRDDQLPQILGRE